MITLAMTVPVAPASLGYCSYLAVLRRRGRAAVTGHRVVGRVAATREECRRRAADRLCADIEDPIRLLALVAERQRLEAGQPDIARLTGGKRPGVAAAASVIFTRSVLGFGLLSSSLVKSRCGWLAPVPAGE